MGARWEWGVAAVQAAMAPLMDEGNEKEGTAMLSSLLESVNARLLTQGALRPREAAELVDMLLTRLSRAYPVVMDAREPIFYIPRRSLRAQPPRLITGRLLRTRWIAESVYELEVLRLLALFGRGREPVEYMLSLTDQRLRLSGFHRLQTEGELPILALAALRFWSAHRPMDWALQDSLLAAMRPYLGADGTFPGLDLPPFYTWMALTTTPSEAALPLLLPSMERLHLLAGLPWPREDAQVLRRSVVDAAMRRCRSGLEAPVLHA